MKNLRDDAFGGDFMEQRRDLAVQEIRAAGAAGDQEARALFRARRTASSSLSRLHDLAANGISDDHYRSGIGKGRSCPVEGDVNAAGEAGEQPIGQAGLRIRLV